MCALKRGRARRYELFWSLHPNSVCQGFRTTNRQQPLTTSIFRRAMAHPRFGTTHGCARARWLRRSSRRTAASRRGRRVVAREKPLAVSGAIERVEHGGAGCGDLALRDACTVHDLNGVGRTSRLRWQYVAEAIEGGRRREIAARRPAKKRLPKPAHGIHQSCDFRIRAGLIDEAGARRGKSAANSRHVWHVHDFFGRPRSACPYR